MSGNRHPADELAEVRQQIRNLKRREAELREMIMELPRVERMGMNFVAIVFERKRRVLNVRKVEEEFGDLSEFYDVAEFSLVQTEKLK
jgi:hypothetical protein